MTRQPNNEQSAAVKEVTSKRVKHPSTRRYPNDRGEHQSERIAKYPRDQILKQTGIQAISVTEQVINIEETKVAKRSSKGPSTQVLSKRPSSIKAKKYGSEHGSDQASKYRSERTSQR
jgi:hypothetical protein